MAGVQKRYLRGQIWHWNDPLYGEKKDGKYIEGFDGTIRYSRYVLVVQDTDTIDTTAIVIPISTTYREGSVEFYINDDKASYARITNVTTVSTKTLDNYICTMVDDDLNKIMAQMKYILGFGEKPNIEPVLTTPTTQTTEKTTEQDDASVGRHKWDKSAMQTFIEDFDNHGVQYASLMYTLSEKSARKYYSNFKIKLAELQK